ncbi:integrase core domain-containing protein [Candidatus Poribacteria bacterium]|nr:integrase core domain-containing protein [Candidatus Poribacteria bacterium]
MASKGAPQQNAYAERLIRTLKEEEVYLNEYEDIQDARRRIGYFLEVVYMQKRVHSALGYLTPKEFEQRWRKRANGVERDSQV